MLPRKVVAAIHPRLAVVVLVDEDAPGENAQRSVHDAHVTVKHEVMDIRAVQQRAHRRHQHRIIGPHQFTQNHRLLRLEQPPEGGRCCSCRIAPQFLWCL